MATSFPPLCRKKKVPEVVKTDTFRVISDEPGPKYDAYTGVSAIRCSGPSVNILGQAVQQMPVNESRNRPSPSSLLCLTSDVKVMMAPIPHVRTRGADPESPWWEHVSSLKPSGVSSAPHTLDSTARSDFQYRGVGLAGNSRYGCNTYNNPAIIGAPRSFTEEGSGKSMFWRESVSFDHQYNSRVDPNYPTKGKRHGSFVWHKIPPNDVDRVLSFYGYTADANNRTATGTACSQAAPVRSQSAAKTVVATNNCVSGLSAV